MTELPQTIDQWLNEISKAYIDARDTIPFGEFVGTTITEEQLYHLAPHVAIKIRGIKRNKTNVKKATEAALSTYVGNKDREGVGDTESGPKSDILGQASAGIRTDHCLEFPA